MNTKEKDKWYELGHIDQLEIEAKSLLKLATDFFANNKDDLASRLRALSLEMKLRAKQMRQDYDAKYHNP